jgi:asparagine synthase (glutamine-hydrolysing)
MCGIFALLNDNGNTPNNVLQREFVKGERRGPESSSLNAIETNCILGFHRLAINGLNEESNQPLIIDDVILICNGEIYNYNELYELINVTPTTGSDCEIIIHLYLNCGIYETLTMLRGVFAFILYDTRPNVNKLFVARDPLGVRPLYYMKNSSIENEYLYGFASELKCLEYFYNKDYTEKSITHFKPGTYSVFNYNNKKFSIYKHIDFTPYFFLSELNQSYNYQVDVDINLIYHNIRYNLLDAVSLRCLTTERPIACLLSGGLDSSLITALVNNYYHINNMNDKLETYSIGLEGSEDLRYARIVADYLGTQHTEIVITEDKMFETIEEVIKANESYDTTTTRASLGNYLLGQYISQHSSAKVIFNGDGSDELFGGYLYMNKCSDSYEFDKETRRLLKDIHLFDVLRSDKSISSHGLEPRTPFLDKEFVSYVLKIEPTIRNHNINKNIEKYLLRESFSEKYFVGYDGRQILPDEILWRKKEAFSDGVSSKGRSLYQLLQDKIATKLTKDTGIHYEPNIDTEKLYYRQIFDRVYPNCESIVPYYWMPKFTNATDPSARTLDIYQKP